MGPKKIEFKIHPHLSKIEIIKPKPKSLAIPTWYKKVEKHLLSYPNIKGCMPFLDGLTAGYVLPLPQDMHLSYNVDNPETGEKDLMFRFSLVDGFHENDLEAYNLNTSKPQIPPTKQFGGDNSYLAKKQNNFAALKILNPWIIRTPPGYSCLFITPTHGDEVNDYFNILTGIVDTDTYENHINFPFIINGDKYDSFSEVFKAGTPYVQIIPFMRDEWKMHIGKGRQTNTFNYNYWSSLINRYKIKIWNKKKWK